LQDNKQSEGYDLYKLIDKYSFLDKENVKLDIILPISNLFVSYPKKLFIVHPGGGLAFPYLPLKDQLNCDIYAINNPYFYQPDKFKNIEDMAALYLKALLDVQRKGPYILAGYSLGGLVAYEIAKQLIKRGLNVDKLILLDTPTKISTPAEEETHCEDLLINKQINTNIKHFTKLASSYDFEYIPTQVLFLKTSKSPHSLKNICNVYREIILEGKHSTIFTEHLSSTVSQLNDILS
jgi:pimeloyl-ACP methyl ester carboxylesterase